MSMNASGCPSHAATGADTAPALLEAGRDLKAQDDLALLRLFFECGRQEAFAEFVQRHQHSAYRMAYACTGHREQSEDAVQEAFMLLADTLGRRALGKVDNIRLWFLGVVSNLALHASRSERRAWKRTALLQSRTAETAGHADAAGFDAETHELLRRAMGQLQTRHRQPLTLYYMEKRNQHEVARLIGVSQSCVARRIEEALVQLRMHLKQHGLECRTIPLPAVLATFNPARSA